ncbi:hypothetical protein [Sediminibacillus halophilus]|uniref:Phage-related protein n=1 Tax=Sediminibacillus halophilus TaxID=482461 RepID=A0A1G9QWT5_9BACI|nr:hypothetical protein [Sediminibacillus halophilus]SDM15492.1 hypothetical protein SAMN05216244_1708 [Sediminibacillus halophilus]
MIKEAIKYLTELGQTETIRVDGQEYSTKPLHLIKEPRPAAIEVNTLSGLVEYLLSNFDTEENLMIHVESPTEVSVFSKTNKNKERRHWIKAEAMVPNFSYDRFYDTESFNIKLQSAFVPNDDRKALLKLASNVQEENVRSTGDDGTSQVVTAKVGVTTVADVKVPNPVTLAPRRTFVEIDQPESEFIFRMQEGPKCALFEADGGAWKIKAMKSIRKYLIQEFKVEIGQGKIHIIA